MPAPVEALERVRLFADLSQRDLKRLSQQLRERRLPAGKRVMTEGQGGIGFFVIEEGEVTVTVGGVERRTLGPGDYFGEMALIEPDATRSATVTATADTICHGMTQWEFGPFVREHPDVAWELLQALAARVREAERREAGTREPS